MEAFSIRRMRLLLVHEFPLRGRYESRPLRLKRLLFMEAFFDSEDASHESSRGSPTRTMRTPPSPPETSPFHGGVFDSEDASRVGSRVSPIYIFKNKTSCTHICRRSARENERNYFLLRLITYAITSAICCCVRALLSPQAGIEIAGFVPAGVEPC
jgi:hypothetical protein